MKILLTILIVLRLNLTATANVVYVNAAATGLNNGTSWTNAYTKLCVSAIGGGGTIGSGIDTVWVANGVYKPDCPSPGVGAGSSFKLTNNNKIFGGFTGTETSLSQRNWSTFQTVLDGDILTPGKADNADDVVYIRTTDTSIVMDVIVDGFKIINGNGSVSTFSAWGGGVLCHPFGSTKDRIQIANCYFADNETAYGGGVCAFGIGHVSITNCRFENNTASISGGAISRWFRGSNANLSLLGHGSLTVTGCTFTGNTAYNGGAIAITDTMPAIFNRCLFQGNTATNGGGAIYDSSISSLKLYNSSIVGNTAAKGGACYTPPLLFGTVSQGHTFIHTTIAHNRAATTAATDYAVPLLGRDTIKNCIIWGNASGSGLQVGIPPFSSVIINNIIQGGGALPNTKSTFTFDPLFVAPGTAAGAPFAATGYSYRLKPLSPAIDTGITGVLPAAFSALDLDSAARVYGARPDLGAYERNYCASAPLTITSSKPLNFCLPDSVKLTALGSAGGSYQWNGGTVSGAVMWAKDSGVYKVIFTDSNGCRVSASVVVNAVVLPNPLITRTGSTLSVPAIYAGYQWYLDGKIIPGAIGSSYTATKNGVYTVRVTPNKVDCSGVSMPYSVTNLAVGSLSGIGHVDVYPNPASGRLTVGFIAQKAIAGVGITFTNITGQQVLRQQYHTAGSSFSKEVDVSGMGKGVYFVEVVADGERVVRRVVIE